MSMQLKTTKAFQEEILRIKNRFGSRLLIPSHHYIRSELVEVSDLTGDSYKLALQVSRSTADYILFCGVSFMAEGAAILAKAHQHIFSPDFTAGCPMADMISSVEAEKACYLIQSLQKDFPVPVVYMNSYIDSKAFAGEHGGSVCTSSNAEKILRYYFSQNKTIFFFPDQNLGCNTALQMGLSKEEIALIDTHYQIKSLSGRKDLDFKKIKIFLWDGYCPLHHHLSSDQLALFKKRYSDAEFLVHPEVRNDLISLAQWSGSTQAILDRLEKAAQQPESRNFVIGTETTFVHRMAKEFPHLSIFPFQEAPCDTMQQITIEKTVALLQELEKAVFAGEALPQAVSVDSLLKEKASLALNQMIKIVEGENALSK